MRALSVKFGPWVFTGGLALAVALSAPSMAQTPASQNAEPKQALPTAAADDPALVPLTPASPTDAAEDDPALVPLTPAPPPDADAEDPALVPLTPASPTDAEVDAAIANRQRELMRGQLDRLEAQNADRMRRAIDELGADEVVVNAEDDVAEARRMDIEREAAEARQAEADQRTAAQLDAERVAAARENARRIDAANHEAFNRAVDEQTTSVNENIESARSDVNNFLSQHDSSTGNALQEWQRNLLRGDASQVQMAQCLSTVSEDKRRTVAAILSTYEQITSAVRSAPQFVAMQIKIRDDSIRATLAEDCGT